MSKHTPGPWEVRQAETGHTAVYPHGGRERIADIYCPLDINGNHAANARLIAAAPELLEACKSILKDYGYDSSIRLQLSEVIAKAEGRTDETGN